MLDDHWSLVAVAEVVAVVVAVVVALVAVAAAVAEESTKTRDSGLEHASADHR